MIIESGHCGDTSQLTSRGIALRTNKRLTLMYTSHAAGVDIEAAKHYLIVNLDRMFVL